MSVKKIIQLISVLIVVLKKSILSKKFNSHRSPDRLAWETARIKHLPMLSVRNTHCVPDVYGEWEKLIKLCLNVGMCKKVSVRVLSHVKCINIHVSVSSPPGMLPERRRQMTSGFRFLTMSHRAIKGRQSNIVVFCMRRRWLVTAFFSSPVLYNLNAI